MRTIPYVLALVGSAIASATAAADNVGEPFGKTVVAPGAPVNTAVHAQGPGKVDDAVQASLADDSDGPIRGYGRTDAPGRN